MSERWRRLPAAVPLLLYAAMLAGFLVHSPFVRQGFPLDDAWIHRVYARSLAAGQGFAYNPGAQEAGFTSPLWLIVSSPAHWFHWLGEWAPVYGVKAIGAALGGLAVAGVQRLARHLGATPWSAALAGCVLALDPRLAYSALSGMEVCLLVALWIGLALAVRAGRAATAFVLAGLAPLARPEAVLLAVGGVAALALVVGRHPVWRRPASWVVLVAPALGWGLFCRLATGHWLPNTFYLKATPFELDTEKLALAWGALTLHGWAASPAMWLPLAGLVAWLALRRTRADAGLAVVLLVLPAAFLVAIVGTRQFYLQGFYWTRWSEPAALVLTGAMGLGLALAPELASRLVARRGAASQTGPAAPHRGHLAGRIAALLLVAAAVPAVASSTAERRSRLASDSRAIHVMNVQAGLWVRANTPEDAVVGVNDAGAIRYFGQRHTVDLEGLNSAGVTFQRVDAVELILGLDWLAVFPGYYRNSNLLEGFDVQQTFRMTDEEYTICDCPNQTLLVIAESRLSRTPDHP